MGAIAGGARPGKPENAEVIGLSPALWQLVRAFWSEDRELRPQIHAITDALRIAATRWHTFPSPSNPRDDGTHPTSLSKTTTEIYQRSWNDLISTTDKANAVRTLAEILVDKEGRAFASRLEREDAKLCIELLDLVSHNLRLSLSPPQMVPLVRASRNITSKWPRGGHFSSR